MFVVEVKLKGKTQQDRAIDSVECARSSISRFFDNCNKNKPAKKGIPRFKKNCHCVEYKQSGWKLSEDRKRITFSLVGVNRLGYDESANEESPSFNDRRKEGV